MTASIFVTGFLVTLFGFIMGMLHCKRIMTKRPDGIFYIDLQDPNEETLKLQIDLAIEEIPKQKYLIFRVQNR